MANYASDIPNSGSINDSDGLLSYNTDLGRFKTIAAGDNVIINPTGSVSQGGDTVSVVLVYRGVLGGQFVFSEGDPPAGATDITVIGSK